eukprot:CAMPEP_0117048156 /NCGR_PEP_ID=MMETSP0472-20121206/33270_1 /TAXON_ID=693140 ORGANISM="Tiarina fusus, Strain LIS" /NCGR_SAMPLE_ID=MMETSP0472 /ASSEMBLY_ACC=CAM_ASM_000603 /LENGTH=78 /DNA_ID=CAMNT_0004761111 /DNA_START=878 /DNA_END=1111 /DNA_ORIENTATION=-
MHHTTQKKKRVYWLTLQSIRVAERRHNAARDRVNGCGGRDVNFADVVVIDISNQHVAEGVECDAKKIRRLRECSQNLG